MLHEGPISSNNDAVTVQFDLSFIKVINPLILMIADIAHSKLAYTVSRLPGVTCRRLVTASVGRL
jgi:hypothetical protein